MQYKLTIPCTLPGLNEYIKAERTNKHKAAAMKRDTEHIISFMIRDQLNGIKLNRPVVMHYTWAEPNRKRDKDNIAFARKFIQDSLVSMKVLPDDGWKYIEGFTDTFVVDRGNPRVEVVIEEIGGRRNESMSDHGKINR